MNKLGVLAGFAACAWLLTVAAVHAEAIQKWRTPNGTLYFGDRPPPGSTLIDTFPDSPPPAVATAASEDSGLAQAAAHGRDIIRRRGAERAAARLEEEKFARSEAADRAWQWDEPEVLIVSTTVFERPCLVRRPPRFAHPRRDFSAEPPWGFARAPSPRVSSRSVRSSSFGRSIQ